MEENVYLKCENCEKGTVRMRRKTNSRTTEIKVFKCDTCKTQYGVRQAGQMSLAS